MNKLTELVVGAGVGALASEILGLLIAEAKIVLAFKSVSMDLASTVEELLPTLTTIASLHKLEDLKTMIDTINKARDLVKKCSGVKGWELHKKFIYTRKVCKIQKKIASFCEVQLQLLQLRNQLESMEEMKKLKLLNEEINNHQQLFIKKLDRFEECMFRRRWSSLARFEYLRNLVVKCDEETRGLVLWERLKPKMRNLRADEA